MRAACVIPTLAVIFQVTGAARGGIVTPEGSYGTSGALTGPNYLITAGLGRQIGTNLFQSFGAFSLINGGTETGPNELQADFGIQPAPRHVSP